MDHIYSGGRKLTQFDPPAFECFSKLFELFKVNIFLGCLLLKRQVMWESGLGLVERTWWCVCLRGCGFKVNHNKINNYEFPLTLQGWKLQAVRLFGTGKNTAGQVKNLDTFPKERLKLWKLLSACLSRTGKNSTRQVDFFDTFPGERLKYFVISTPAKITLFHKLHAICFPMNKASFLTGYYFQKS